MRDYISNLAPTCTHVAGPNKSVNEGSAAYLVSKFPTADASNWCPYLPLLCSSFERKLLIGSHPLERKKHLESLTYEHSGHSQAIFLCVGLHVCLILLVLCDVSWGVCVHVYACLCSLIR